MKVCIFCGPTTAKMSGEHIYSDWISKKLRSFGINLYRVTRFRDGVPFNKKSGSIELKTRPCCCEPCNNEWLGDIERKYLSKFFFPIIRGKKTTLSYEEQILLGWWLTRLALAFEFTGEAKERTFYTQEEREQFRADSYPPDLTKIWIGYYRGPHRATVGSHEVAGTSPKNNRHSARFRVTQGTIGRFAFQVFSIRTAGFAMTEDQIDQAFKPSIRDWANATLQVWPELGKLLQWPPLPIVDNRALEAFAERFGGKVPPMFDTFRD